MKKEFVPYEQALELKEIGFDEECLVLYDGRNSNEIYFNSVRDGSGDYRPFKSNDKLGWIGAPLYQQAFRWFRNKYNIAHSIDWMTRSGGEYPSGYIAHFRGINENILPIYNLVLNQSNLIVLNKTVFPTYEEAELACLIKLIEMVKNK